LFERLSGPAQVAVVSAPAGSGKTVLLRSWIAQAGLAESAGWVAAGPDERDPQRFWLAVLSALRGTAPGSALVQALTATPDLDGWAVVERLLTDLAPLRDPLWLVVDDLHELGPFIRRMRSTPATAQIHVSEPLRLDAYGVAATMVPVGGHTPGSSVVLLDDGDAVVGDLFRAGFGLGRICPGHPLRHYFAEHPDGVRQGLDLVLRHDPALLHVAHGGPSVPVGEIRRRLDRIAPRHRP
jgi:glyoxylase-like metal-dependent hydrolase (beta-lactamase superfamily II)